MTCSKGISFLMGKNGCGKTTLIKCLLGLESYQGCVTYGDAKQQIFSVFDDTPLYPNLTGYENIRIILKDVHADVSTLDFNILSDRILKEKVKRYSLGQKKKIFLLIICLKRPTYLFLDEVSNGMDIDTLYQFSDILKHLSKDSFIFVTGHHVEFYEKLIDQVFVLNHAQLAYAATFKKGEDQLHDIYQKYT